MGDLSEHFSQHEFSCRCNRSCTGKGAPDPRLITALEQLRELVGRPVMVTTALGKNGGNRCPRHNSVVGGAPRSQHRNNRAADIYAVGLAGLDLALLAIKIPEFRNGGIGVAGNHIHVDVRKGRSRWDYASAQRGALAELKRKEKKEGVK
jgi:uncharacterized protein YcbK (DUF882 family)